jgi:hypothetical protein
MQPSTVTPQQVEPLLDPQSAVSNPQNSTGHPNPTASANGTAVRTENRPTTSGKSLELLEQNGLMNRKRVRLLLGRREGKEVYSKEEEELSDSSDDHMEVDKDVIHHRPQRKRRRIISAATVPDDEPEDKMKAIVDEEREYDGWETYESEKICSHCAAVGVFCRSFVLRSHGAPRFACCRCHDKKKICEFTKPRRLVYVKIKNRGRTAAATDGDDADGEEDSKSRRKQIQKEKRKQQTGPDSRRAKSRSKTVGDSFRSGSNDDDEDAGEIQRRRKAGGKEKGKGKRRERNDTESRGTSVKWEDNEDGEWFASKCQYFVYQEGRLA